MPLIGSKKMKLMILRVNISVLRPTIIKIMSKALDKDETLTNINSLLEWSSDQFKFVLNNELFSRNHIQSYKSVPESKIENH
jgi:hypothetical protein